MTKLKRVQKCKINQNQKKHEQSQQKTVNQTL